MNRRKFVIETGAFLLSPALIEAASELRSQSQAPRLLTPIAKKCRTCWSPTLAKTERTSPPPGTKKRALLKTAADVETRNAFVREKFVQMLRGFPEKNDLNSVTVKTIQKDGYRIENVMFQSPPDFWVTGNHLCPNPPAMDLFRESFRPADITRWPGWCRNTKVSISTLVKSGFVVLGYDPIGQGERRQYWNPKNKCYPMWVRARRMSIPCPASCNY